MAYQDNAKENAKIYLHEKFLKLISRGKSFKVRHLRTGRDLNEKVLTYSRSPSSISRVPCALIKR